jgi:tetratricopeptide (TPR) repeat protein
LVLLLSGLGYAGYLLNFNMKVNSYLAQAEQRLSEDKLLTPYVDNADYYFRQVLLLDPNNAVAQDGLLRVLAARVIDSINLGQLRLSNIQLLSPVEDNAVFYFQQALGLDPDNQQAQDGLAKVADVYIDQANAAYVNRKFAQALESIQLGLQVQPENVQLLKLRSEHAAYVKRATEPKVVAVKPKKSSTSTSANRSSTKGEATARATDKETTSTERNRASEVVDDISDSASRIWNHVLSNGMD